MSTRSPSGLSAYQIHPVTPATFKVAPAHALQDAPGTANASLGPWRDQVRAASATLVDAFNSLHGRTEPVYTVSVTPAVPIAAEVSGQVPRSGSTPGAFSTVRTTQPIDPSATVGAGSFTVNGVAIAVANHDSVTDVLGKITASDAGVAAVYDDATRTVTLASTNATATPVVTGNDTSGFLAAAKLDASAITTVGEEPVSALDSPLNRMAQYSSVHAGSVIVNGHVIVVDPATTAIRGLVSALNRIDGQSATLDEATGTLKLSSSSDNNTLDIADTSGVLAALGMRTGVVQGSRGAAKITTAQAAPATASNAEAVVAGVTTAVDGLNGLLSQLNDISNVSRQARGEVEAGVRATLQSLEAAGVQGLSVTADDTTLRVSVDHNALASSLAQNADVRGDQRGAHSRLRTPAWSAVQLARLSLPARAPHASTRETAARTYVNMQSASSPATGDDRKS